MENSGWETAFKAKSMEKSGENAQLIHPFTRIDHKPEPKSARGIEQKSVLDEPACMSDYFLKIYL